MALDNKDRIVRALDAARWNLSEAARRLGVSRRGLYDAMARHKIKRLPPKEPVDIVSARKRRAARARWDAQPRKIA